MTVMDLRSLPSAKVYFDPERDPEVTGVVIDGHPMVRLGPGLYAGPIEDAPVSDPQPEGGDAVPADEECICDGPVSCAHHDLVRQGLIDDDDGSQT